MPTSLLASLKPASSQYLWACAHTTSANATDSKALLSVAQVFASELFTVRITTKRSSSPTLLSSSVCTCVWAASTSNGPFSCLSGQPRGCQGERQPAAGRVVRWERKGRGQEADSAEGVA